jgi:FkbM family methyltransferase
MRNIFIDIGAHIGESIEIVTSQKYNFDVIYAVEPSPFCKKYLNKFKDQRIEIIPFGFGSENKSTTLFGSGSVGASIFLEKTPYWSVNEKINILKFSQWYQDNITENDLVWIKLNAEGAELEIIQELKYIHTQKIVSILISFDIEKIPSLSKQKRELIKILGNLQIPFNERRKGFEVTEWLDNFHQIKAEINLSNFLHVMMRPDIPWSRNVRRIIKPLVPNSIWLFLAIKFGPNRKR